MSGTGPEMDTKMREDLGDDWDKFAVAKKGCTAAAFTAAAIVLARAQKLFGLKFHPKDPQSSRGVTKRRSKRAT